MNYGFRVLLVREESKDSPGPQVSRWVLNLVSGARHESLNVFQFITLMFFFSF